MRRNLDVQIRQLKLQLAKKKPAKPKIMFQHNPYHHLTVENEAEVPHLHRLCKKIVSVQKTRNEGALVVFTIGAKEQMNVICCKDSVIHDGIETSLDEFSENYGWHSSPRRSKAGTNAL